MNQLIANFMYARLLLLTIFLFSVSGCSLFGGGEDPIDPKRKDVALVFGYIDMEDAPSSLDWVKIKRYKPTPQHAYYAGTEGYLFFHVGVDLGSYQVEKFGNETGFFTRTAYTYHFGTTGKNDSARRITKPGVYYLGSYKYVVLQDNWIAPDKVALQTTTKPTEKELLVKLLKIMQEDYSEYKYQIKWIKQRLAAL